MLFKEVQLYSVIHISISSPYNEKNNSLRQRYLFIYEINMDKSENEIMKNTYKSRSILMLAEKFRHVLVNILRSV